MPNAIRRIALQLLETLPDGIRLCHFDFHPEQVLMSANDPVVIDWRAAMHGDPLADGARI